MEHNQANSGIDYSPLTAPVSESEIQEFQQLYGKKGIFSGDLATLIVSFGVGFVISRFVFVFAASLIGTSWISQLIVVAVVAAVMIIILKTGMQRELIKNVKRYKFAAKNNMSLAIDISDPQYPGMIFNEGHSRRISTQLNGEGFRVGLHNYVVGHGKNSRSYSWLFICIELQRVLPHMVLDSKQNNVLGISNLTDPIKRSQKLSLEGDFDKYFTLYAPAQYGQDALYVFTPDVMSALINYGARYDMEIIGDQLYLYSNSEVDFFKQTWLEKAFALIDVLKHEVGNQTKRYSDSRVATEYRGQAIASGGQRLQKSSFITKNMRRIVIAIIFMLIYYSLHFLFRSR